MRRKAFIFVLLAALLLIPAVYADDAQDWNTKGQYAITVGDYADAITYFNNALAIDQNLVSAISGKAVALNGLGRYSDALSSAQQALAFRSSDPVSLNAEAYALYKLGRWDESVAAYNLLFKVQPNLPAPFCLQGDAYMQLKPERKCNNFVYCLHKSGSPEYCSME